MSETNGQATAMAEPSKLVPKQGRIATLEDEVTKLRRELDEVRWCFMEFLYHCGVAQKAAQLQALMADPDVQRMLRAQNAAAGP
ncbi:hypothetical protein [Mycobacterium palustre]|uniref:Uncharacterized protein n=1 Tax=Mycobacterium palustre TaxID=153971 RepID=A0A1X1ZKW9_9MYCO|nr:hypothetical protein [Mycobacterium palustre]ORW24003.1 hypothetical protein AWC19_00150 [Mycobacterium palustre]